VKAQGTTAANPAFPADNILPGVMLMLVFCAIAPLIDTAAKMASQTVSVGQVTLARMVVQATLMLPVVLWLRQSFRLSRRQLGLTVLRAALLAGSTLSFVAAVQVMPIADALAIVFVEPFLLLALGFLLFGEQVGPRRIIASVVGFGGALLVIQPNFVVFGTVALFPLATAGFFALYMLVTRHLSREVPPEAMQFHTAWTGTLVMVPILALGHGFDLQPLQLSGAPWATWEQLFGVGLAATLAHLAITHALRRAPSATLAPLQYLEIVTAVGVGWLFFGDWPNPLSWAGIAVITASGLYIIARERSLAMAARRTEPAAPPPAR
jgi:drug/metabolite transporter (DMT)-like permease